MGFGLGLRRAVVLLTDHVRAVRGPQLCRIARRDLPHRGHPRLLQGRRHRFLQPAARGAPARMAQGAVAVAAGKVLLREHQDRTALRSASELRVRLRCRRSLRLGNVLHRHRSIFLAPNCKQLDTARSEVVCDSISCRTQSTPRRCATPPPTSGSATRARARRTGTHTTVTDIRLCTLVFNKSLRVRYAVSQVHTGRWRWKIVPHREKESNCANRASRSAYVTHTGTRVA